MLKSGQGECQLFITEGWLKLGLIQKGLIIVFLPLAFELVLVFILFSQLQEVEREARQEARAKEILAVSSKLVKLTFDIGFIASAALDLNKTTPALAQKFDRTVNTIADCRRRLTDVVSENPGDIPSLQELNRVYDFALEQIEGVRAFMHGRCDAETSKGIESYRHYRDRLAEDIQDRFVKFVSRYQEIEKSAPEAQRKLRDRQRQILLIGLSLNVGLAFALALFFSRGVVVRLQVLTDNTRRLSEGRPLAEILPGSDEIAGLDKVFHEMADALALAAEQKQEIMSMVTHDLRTPLTSIFGVIGLLAREGERGFMREPAVRQIGIMEKNVQRLIKMINDLLDYDKLEAGAFTLDAKPTKVEELLEKSVQAVEGLARQKAVKLAVGKPEAGLEANLDEDRIIQVLVNLLSNAVKFSPPDETVTVSVDRHGEMIEFRVSDRGRGIPSGSISSIFERYKQVQTSDGNYGKGTGLGLPICKMLIEAHKGAIGVESEQNEGATFWFRVPR